MQAEHLHRNVYKIVEQPYERAIEAWRFEPGDKVVCELIPSSDGEILAATALAED